MMTDTAKGELKIRKPREIEVRITKRYEQAAAPMYLILHETVTLHPNTWAEVPTRLIRHPANLLPERHGDQNCASTKSSDRRLLILMQADLATLQWKKDCTQEKATQGPAG